MSVEIIRNKDLKEFAFKSFIVLFICLNLFLAFKFYLNLHKSIFEEPSNILFWDDWSILDKNFIKSITTKHNEHQLTIPIAISWLSYKFTGLTGGFNLLFSSLFRIISLIFYVLTIKKICKISFSKNISLNSFLVISLSVISGIIFINYPTSYRTLNWGFMLHWYIPLSILFLNGYLILNNKLTFKLFLISYLLVLISYFSGSQWIVCLSSLSILIFLRSINSKKNLFLNSLFSIIFLIIIDSLAGNSSSLTLNKLINFNFSFFSGIIWHAFNLSFPFLIIVLIMYLINIFSTDEFKKVASDPAFQFSTYIFSSGIVFSVIVTIARGNYLDANTFSPSYPTYTSLIPFSIITLITFEINKKSIFDVFGKIYFLIINLFFSYALLSKFYIQNISTIKEERYWQNISFVCRVLGYQFIKKGYQVVFDPTCGQTYPSDEKLFKKMGNPIFANGFNNILGEINTESSGLYELKSFPIIRTLPFVKKITISEIKNDISSKGTFIKIIHEELSKENSKKIKIKIENR